MRVMRAARRGNSVSIGISCARCHDVARAIAHAWQAVGRTEQSGRRWRPGRGRQHRRSSLPVGGGGDLRHLGDPGG
jgi:cytochrome c peroxidase